MTDDNVTKMPHVVERVFAEIYGKDHTTRASLIEACRMVFEVVSEIAPGFTFTVRRQVNPNVVAWEFPHDGIHKSAAIRTQDMLRDPGLVLALLLQARDTALIVTGRTTMEDLPRYLAETYGAAPRLGGQKPESAS